jgi:hypothetical protein
MIARSRVVRLEDNMSDISLSVLTLTLFIATIGYAVVCERL